MSNGLNSLARMNNGRIDSVGIPKSSVEQLVVDDADGVVQRNLNSAKKPVDEAREKFSEARESILAASGALHDAANETSKKAKEAISRAKDQAAQMTDAFNKMQKMLGPDFEKRLAQLKEFTDCMERLNLLEKAGRLEAIFKALK